MSDNLPVDTTTDSALSGSQKSSEEDSQPPTFKVYKPYASTVIPQPSTAIPCFYVLSTLLTLVAAVLSDDYFTPTAADLKAAQASLAARTSALVNAPLQLRAVREASEKARRDRWPQTTIRVRFPDRMQLEKVFQSNEKIRSVYAFVRGCLREDVKPIKFVLYQSPPKREFKVSDPKVRDLTLSELQLAPSSILLLRFEDETLNHHDTPSPLETSILSQAVELPLPKTQEEIPTREPLPISPTVRSEEKKIPKWLKMGLKK